MSIFCTLRCICEALGILGLAVRPHPCNLLHRTGRGGECRGKYSDLKICSANHTLAVCNSPPSLNCVAKRQKRVPRLSLPLSRTEGWSTPDRTRSQTRGSWCCPQYHASEKIVVRRKMPVGSLVVCPKTEQ